MLTKKMQIQAVVDRLHGLPTTLTAANLAEPWRTCWQALENADGNKRDALVLAMQDRDDRDAILGAVFSAVPGAPLGHFPSLLEMDQAGLLAPIEWLWTDWIPLGMLSLLTASPGAGKSMVALDLAGRIIESTTFPDGSPIACTRATVVYVDAEATPQIHNERIEMWGIDRSRLYLMVPDVEDLFIDLNQTVHRDRLVEMITTVNPGLVVIDSLSTISLKGENNKEDVMQLLGFLSRVALEFNCGMLLIHHLRKRSVLPMGDVLTQDDVRGSGHIVAAARSVLGLSIIQTGAEPDRNGPRRLEVLKTNLTRYPRPIGLELIPRHPKGVLLKYGPVPERYEAPTKIDSCTDWLLAVLEELGEPAKPAELVELAADEGYGRALVYKSKKLLEGQIINTRGRKDPHNKWALAEWQDQEEEK